jgi:hypothetical protein
MIGPLDCVISTEVSDASGPSLFYHLNRSEAPPHVILSGAKRSRKISPIAVVSTGVNAAKRSRFLRQRFLRSAREILRQAQDDFRAEPALSLPNVAEMTFFTV